MSFVNIDNNNFESITLNLKPTTHFISSSIGAGVTGSNFVSPFRSKVLKKNTPASILEGGAVLESDLTSPDAFLGTIKSGKGTGVSYTSLNKYMSLVGSTSQVDKNTKTIDIFRFDQPTDLNKNRTIKNIVRKTLMPHHQHRFDNCHFSYSNYHTLNFFDTETIPTGSALIYPNVGDVYDLPDSFSVNFWINPRYSDPGEYKSGTVLHLSSSICISLVSGSTKDDRNAADKFKIMVQLSQSADLPPSMVDLSYPSTSYPNDLIFTSSGDLLKNHWHHVCVQWSNNTNNSTGSIFIDNSETKFHINSASLSANSNLSPPGLVLGNYFDAPYGVQANFLNSGSAESEGFLPNVDGSIFDPTLTENMLSHPLNAEIHEVKIYNKTLNTFLTKFQDERERARDEGPDSYNNLVFYVPPFFYPKSTERDVLVTPFQTIRDYTDDPFNVAFSFGVNGKMINLENFTREFVQGRQPRHLGLVPQTINNTIQNITADQYVYNSGSIKKRNMTILPNDNGLFKPNYFVLSNSDMSASMKWSNDPNKIDYDYSIISLENLIPSSSLYPGLIATTGSIFNQIVGASPENPGVSPGAVLTIAQRTRDLSSNEIVIADISNLYYGNRIHPGSFQMYENDLTGSDGKITLTIKDNERGSLYRGDALTKNATWNSVGNLFYEDGIALIKSPHLFYLGKDLLDIKFKGEQNLHTMIINIPAFPEMFNSSSNPTFKKITPSKGANNEELETVYITTVNIHDDNFNIIMKANFSQPIFKTEEDEFIIRLKEDF